MNRWMWFVASILGGWIAAGVTICVSDWPDSQGRRPAPVAESDEGGYDAEDVKETAKQIFGAGL